MGSSLRKKRKAKASGTTVKVGRVKKTTQKVSVKPVLLPGAKDETEWDRHTTHQNNYDHVGIVSDSNKVGKTGRNSQKLVELGEGADSAAVAKAKREADTSVAAQATVGGDEVRGMMGQVRSTGLAPPKRLTTKQRRIVGALVARDRKLNAMQHTVSALRELVVSYVAYPELVEGGGSLDFRAPKKTSCKGKLKV